VSAYMLSQLLVSTAILFDIASFQFKQRSKILTCLCFAGCLISAHFVLLEHWTAAVLMMIATLRYFTSLFTTSKHLAIAFILASVIATMTTFSGLTSIVSCLGAMAQTWASFCQHDKQLRQFMIVGTGLWLTHNILVLSPGAIAMESLFLLSNIIGYYRFYSMQSTPAK